MVTPRAERPAAESALEVVGGRSILVVEDDPDIQGLVAIVLRDAGFEVTVASNGEEGLHLLGEQLPDLILSDVVMPVLTGTEFLRRVRADARTQAVPVILLTSRDAVADVVEGLALGADDYLTKPFHIPELLARVRAKLERPPIPFDQLPRHARSGLFTGKRWRAELERELERAAYTGRKGAVAVVELVELAALRSRFGTRQDSEIARRVRSLLAADALPLEVHGRDDEGRFLLLLPECASDEVERRLERIARRIAACTFSVTGERLRLTPAVGWSRLVGGEDAGTAVVRSLVALDTAASRLDLLPVRHRPELDAAVAERRRRAVAETRQRERSGAVRGLRTAFQILLTMVASLVVPFFGYHYLASRGYDISRLVYLMVVAGLVMTCVMIWAEGFKALRRIDPPAEPASPYPAASAIIAAYLPNEAATIVETLEAFRRLDYPGDLQIILAYNTPRDLPVESTLRTLASRDARLKLLRVAGSESKAQNVNAALSVVTGEFVGVFDADHHPDPDSFARAWRWLSHGADVVQGHCLVRNGDASWVSRLVAVEFEQIYAVSHPGRARLHGFGIFGGSNGYWRTSLLRETRMRGFMLTEDIDSSMRVVGEGKKIVSDPFLISRELAPSTLPALWNQRLRWAQGWFQVSIRHFLSSLFSRRLTVRNKVGLSYLLLWREIFAWLSQQIVPIVAFWATRRGGLAQIDWFVPLFVCTTLFTLATGPGLVFFTYRLADPQIRSQRRWFFSYVALSLLFYSGFKNLIARVAQVKQAMGEKSWRVTPRQKAGV